MSTMNSAATARSTVDALAATNGKAELVRGRIVALKPTGLRPNLVAGRIYRGLADHVDTTGRGLAFTDNMGFVVPELTSGRESFSPDVAYYDGEYSVEDMRFIQGAPTFAVEVRSEHDQGLGAERALAAERADYFEAGTLVVWDVDPVDLSIRAYQADDPESPRTFRSGDIADAEPAVSGWRISVDRIAP